MQTVEIQAAETDLSRLVDAAEAGEEIVLARAGKPVAKIVALEAGTSGSRQLGIMAGEFTVPADFDLWVLNEFEPG